MSEFLPEFCGEYESRICGDALEPLFGEIRAKRLIERSVDFNRVKELSEIGGFVESTRLFCGVDDARPICVDHPAGPTRICCAGGSEVVLGHGRCISELVNSGSAYDAD